MVRQPDNIIKRFDRKADFDAELRGVTLVDGMLHVPHAQVHQPLLSIKYERGVPLIDILDVSLLWPCLIGASNALDEFHRRGLSHGDVYVGNMVVRMKGVSAGTILLVGLETVKPNASLEDMSRDIINFLDDMMIRLPKVKGTISMIKDMCTEKVTVSSSRSYLRVKEHIIGNLTDLMHHAQ